ncbi:MAG TPA: DNA polymerase III subunit delta [Syntrophales bacterium]|nr:DNA polymerase III subunit delta [Syntrophales bacterium]
MDIERILKDLTKGKSEPSPCYLLYGDEDYLIKQALNRIIEAMIPASDRDMNLFLIDGENEDIESLCDAALTPPLIPGRKVVALTNTRLFHTRTVLPDILQKIRQHLENDPDAAVRYFIQFLKITGWTIGDLRDGGWKKIADGNWQKIVDGDSGRDREAWLPEMIDICIKRGIEVRGHGDVTERLEDVLRKGLPAGIHLIITAETVDKRKRLYKVISETGTILNFSRLKGEAKQRDVLMVAARDLLMESGKDLTPDAWLAIGRKTGFDLAESMKALETLISYTGQKKSVEASDVEEAIGKTREDTVFDLTGAIVSGKLDSALSSLKDLFDQGINHVLILSMIAREVRFLLHAKMFIRSGEVGTLEPRMNYEAFQRSVYPLISEWKNDKGGKGGLESQHPYVIYNAMKNSYRFSYDRLTKYLQDLVDMDVAFKTTAKDPKFILERFIVEMCTWT